MKSKTLQPKRKVSPRASSSRIALVTGASRGLGLELAAQLIAAGFQVIGVSRTTKHWSTAQKKVNSKNFLLVQADISDSASVDSLFQCVKEVFPKLDLVVNNAAYGGKLERIEETTPEEFANHLRENLFSVFLMSRAAFPFLKKSKQPLVINVSSMAGVRAVPRIAGYSASKFGVLAMTEAFAKENLDWLKVITVCPGGMNTQMRAELFGKEDAAKQQTPAFVADKMMQMIQGEIPLLTASHVVIRHGTITQIMVPPNN